MKNLDWGVFAIGVGMRYSKSRCVKFLRFHHLGTNKFPEFLSQDKLGYTRIPSEKGTKTIKRRKKGKCKKIRIENKYKSNQRISKNPPACRLASKQGGEGVLIVMHGHSRMTIDPRIHIMPGRSTSGFHRHGRDR